MENCLRVGLLSAIQSVDPLHAQDFASAMVVVQIFETLYSRPTRNQGAEPLLFGEKLQGDPESMRFSAKVRRGSVFSDGTPLTAELVAASLKRSAPMRDQAEVTAEGDRVVFQLTRPNARFDLVLTQTYAAITLEKNGKYYGTGSYVAAPESTPELMRLVRNPHHKPPAEIEEVVFRCYPTEEDGQPAKLVEAIRRGEVDFSNMLPREEVSALTKVRKYFELGSSTAFLYMNTERPGLRDERVRQAIAMAIDRLDLASLNHKHALAHTAASVLPPMMSSWRDSLRAHPERAKALLQEAGAAAPAKLTMRVIFGPRPYLPHPQRSAEFIAERLGELGIEVDVRQTEDPHDYYNRLAGGDYDLFLTGWIADTADPADFLEAILSSEAIPQPDEPISIHANLGRWRDEDTDRLLRDLRRDPDESTQQKLLQIAADKLPAYPLMYGAISFVHAWRVHNFEPPPLGIPDFATLKLRALMA